MRTMKWLAMGCCLALAAVLVMSSPAAAAEDDVTPTKEEMKKADEARRLALALELADLGAKENAPEMSLAAIRLLWKLNIGKVEDARPEKSEVVDKGEGDDTEVKGSRPLTSSAELCATIVEDIKQMEGKLKKDVVAQYLKLAEETMKTAKGPQSGVNRFSQALKPRQKNGVEIAMVQGRPAMVMMRSSNGQPLMVTVKHEGRVLAQQRGAMVTLSFVAAARGIPRHRFEIQNIGAGPTVYEMVVY